MKLETLKGSGMSMKHLTPVWIVFLFLVSSCEKSRQSNHEPGFQEAPVYLSDIEFTDESLKMCARFQENKIEYITNFGCDVEFEVDDLTGLEYLTNLVSLNLNLGVKVKNFPTEHFKNLRKLRLTNAPSLEYIDVSNLPHLKSLNIGPSELESLDIANNQSLEDLIIIGANIDHLDASKNVNLRELTIVNAGLRSLDLSMNSDLIWIDLSNNKLEELDVDNNVLLEFLSLDNNSIEKLDLCNNKNIHFVSVNSNGLESLDVSCLRNLKHLKLENNSLSDIDFHPEARLYEIALSSNFLSFLDLSSMSSMQALYLANNQLEKLSLAAGVEVGEVDISGNSITCSEYAFDAQFGLCVDGPGNTVFDQVVKHLNLVGCFSADAFYKSVHFVRCSGQVKPDTKFLQIPCYRASLGGH